MRRKFKMISNVRPSRSIKTQPSSSTVKPNLPSCGKKCACVGAWARVCLSTNRRLSVYVCACGACVCICVCVWRVLSKRKQVVV